MFQEWLTYMIHKRSLKLSFINFYLKFSKLPDQQMSFHSRYIRCG